MKTAHKIALIAWLWIFVINIGTFGVVDTQYRVKMAHAWWTGTPEVDPDYRPQYRGDTAAGVLGARGKRYIPYDLGQSLLVLPGDWVGTKLYDAFPRLGEKFWRRLTLNFLIFMPLGVAAVVACYELLKLFNFGESLAGVTSLIWLLGTTVFHYAQLPQQNNQILLFVLLGYATALASVLRNSPRYAIFSGLALGMAILIRMTNIIHAFTVFLFLVSCLFYQERKISPTFKLSLWWIAGFIPLTLLGRILDYIRLGSFWATTQSLGGKQVNTDPIFAGFPLLPENFPFVNPPYIGILGVLFAPAKSIFIYDPFLLPCLILGFVAWKKLSPYIRLYVMACLLNVGLHILFTSRLDFWHGDSAWGARYHVTSVQLLLIPLLAFFLQQMTLVSRIKKGLMAAVIALAIMAQFSSIVLPPSVETDQIILAPVRTFFKFRLGERVANIACMLSPAISPNCAKRIERPNKSSLYKQIQAYLFAFNFTGNRVLSLGLVGITLMVTIVLTVRFCILESNLFG